MLRCVKFYASFYVKIIDIEKGGICYFLVYIEMEGGAYAHSMSYNFGTWHGYLNYVCNFFWC